MLELGGDVTGRFDISTGVGSISIDLSLGIEVDRHFVSATASGSARRGGPRYELTSGAGSIKVTIR